MAKWQLEESVDYKAGVRDSILVLQEQLNTAEVTYISDGEPLISRKVLATCLNKLNKLHSSS